MSRIAKQPILINSKVVFTVKDNIVSVEGPLGKESLKLIDGIKVNFDNNQVTLEQVKNSTLVKAMMGTTRMLIDNMVKGVLDGFTKKLVLVGVGYKAELQSPNKIKLNLGYSHPIEYTAPESIKFELPSATEIVISGPVKQVVGQVASEIRKYRLPEPYKGKGVKYHDEIIKIKEAKKK